MPEALELFQGDARPYWQPTVRISGQYEDMSTGYGFEVRIGFTREAPPEKTKTANITGGVGGLVTIAWDVADTSDLDPGRYKMLLIVTRTIDSKPWTVQRDLIIKGRMPSV